MKLGTSYGKKTSRKKIKEPEQVAKIFSEAIQPLRKLEIDSIANVLAVAIQRKLTFYDASYAYVAEKENLKLVTGDTDLLEKCKLAITIKEM